MMLTDVDERVQPLKANASMNASILGDCQLNVAALDWFSERSAKSFPSMDCFDLVIASECIYEGDEPLRAMLDTAFKLLCCGGTLLILSATHRDGVELLKEYFVPKESIGQPPPLYHDRCDSVDIYFVRDDGAWIRDNDDCEYIILRATKK